MTRRAGDPGKRRGRPPKPVPMDGMGALLASSDSKAIAAHAACAIEQNLALPVSNVPGAMRYLEAAFALLRFGAFCDTARIEKPGADFLRAVASPKNHRRRHFILILLGSYQWAACKPGTAPWHNETKAGGEFFEFTKIAARFLPPPFSLASTDIALTRLIEQALKLKNDPNTMTFIFSFTCGLSREKAGREMNDTCGQADFSKIWWRDKRGKLLILFNRHKTQQKDGK